MSHALCIYVQPLDESSKPVPVATYFGTSNMYSLFRDCDIQHFAFEEDDYAILDIENINILLKDLNDDIAYYTLKRDAYKDIKSLSDEQFSEMLSTIQYLAELKETKQDVLWLSQLITNTLGVQVKVLFNND